MIVIGAGMGGLSSSAILARAGYKVLLIERRDHVGGCTASFDLKCGDDTYTFDSSLHQTSPNISSLNAAGIRALAIGDPKGAVLNPEMTDKDAPKVVFLKFGESTIDELYTTVIDKEDGKKLVYTLPADLFSEKTIEQLEKDFPASTMSI